LCYCSHIATPAKIWMLPQTAQIRPQEDAKSLWDVTPFRPVNSHRRFGRPLCLYVQEYLTAAQKMAWVCSTVTIYRDRYNTLADVVFIRLAVMVEHLAWLQKCTKHMKPMIIMSSRSQQSTLVVTFIIYGTSSVDSRLTKYICYKSTTWLSIALTIFVTFRCQAIADSC